jgi:hypothetical protein
MLWTLLRICRFHTIREINCWVTNRLSTRIQFILIFTSSNLRILVRLQWVHKIIFYNVMISGSYSNHWTFIHQLRRSILTLSYRPFTFPGLTTLFCHSQLKLICLHRVVQLSLAAEDVHVQFCIHGLFVAFNNIAFVWNVTRYTESTKYEQICPIPYEEICPL